MFSNKHKVLKQIFRASLGQKHFYRSWLGIFGYRTMN